MAKTTVDEIVDRIQRRIDYVPSEADSDLDTLTIDTVNDALKVLKQLFMDYSLLDEISIETTITTTADQEYVDISTVTDLDEIITQSERTNDRTIELITFEDYRRLFPDPTADSSSTPDYAARHYNRIYFGPTPNTALTIYFDYIRLLSDVAAGGTLPFESKYDPLVIALAKRELVEWLDSKNAVGIAAAQVTADRLKKELIITAAKNIGLNQQTKSRRFTYWGPRKQLTSPSYGFGVGGFGAGGFGGVE